MFRNAFNTLSLFAALYVVSSATYNARPTTTPIPQDLPWGTNQIIPSPESIQEETPSTRVIPKPVSFSQPAPEEIPQFNKRVVPEAVSFSEPEPIPSRISDTPPLPDKPPQPEGSYTYKRPSVILEPYCMPDKYTLLQYWKTDLARASPLIRMRICDERCMRRSFGSAYDPIVNAIMSGEREGNATEAPEAYVKVIRERCTARGGCGGGHDLSPQERSALK